jgi:hypothetical protein
MKTWIEIKTWMGWTACELTDICNTDTDTGKVYRTVIFRNGNLMRVPADDIDSRPNNLVRPTFPRQWGV